MESSQAVIEGIPSGPPTRSRIGWVDDAKGIGIVLVVFGHVWRGVFKAGLPIPDGIYNFVDQWIYAFHMPLFFLLSGLFIERSARKPADTFVLNKLNTLIYPYFVWTILQWVATKASGGGANSSATANDLLFSPIQPYLHFWFLYVLFLSSLIALAAFKWRVGAIGLMIVAVIFVWMPVNLDFWPALYELKLYLPFFALGALLSGLLLGKLRDVPPEILIVAGIISAIALTLAIHLNFYNNTAFELIPCTAGMAMTLAAAVLIDRTSIKAIKFLGALSLPIYVAHVIAAGATRLVLLKVLHIHNVPIHVVAGTFAGIAAPIGLVVFTQWASFPYLFTAKK